jgi:hypothetical protein
MEKFGTSKQISSEVSPHSSDPLSNELRNEDSVEGQLDSQNFGIYPLPEENESEFFDESQSESPSVKMIRLRQQKNNATERLNSEFWPDELDAASIFQTRELLRKSARLSGVETTDDDVDITPRVRVVMQMNNQVSSVDAQIDGLYDKNPELVESRIKEIISEIFTPDRLALAKNEGVLTFYHVSRINPIASKELETLLSKYEKHQGYDRSKDIDTPETQSPQYDFVEGYVLQLILERANEVAAYEALSPEEKERYPDKQTVRKKLSYQDADLPPEQLQAMHYGAEGRNTAERYAHHLNHLPEQEVARVLPQIKGQTKKVLDVLGIPVSPYGKSDSWVYWDFGKQQFYYEQNKGFAPSEGNPYRYAPALEKLDEISDRHIGWEFYHAPAEAREKAFKSIEDTYYLARVFDILQNEPKADGQLHSHQYAELGKVLREYAHSFETKQYNSDLNIAEISANFEGNDSELLFERLRNPNIFDQIVKMWKIGYKGMEGRKQLRPRTDSKGNEVLDKNGSYVFDEVTFVTPAEMEIAENIRRLIDEAQTVTPIYFDSRSPTVEGMGIFWKLPNGDTPTSKQKSIALAHEKGHIIRQLPDGNDPFDEHDFYKEVFGKVFDFNQIVITNKNVEEFNQNRRQELDPSTDLKDVDENHVRMSAIRYLSRPVEIIERLGQLKNYFGMRGDEKFTQAHLDYARSHYVNDTGLDNSMTHFFDAIKNDVEFLNLINSAGV